MRLRRILVLAAGLLVPAGPLLARPAHRAAPAHQAPAATAPVASRAGTAGAHAPRGGAVGAEAMIARTGAARRSAPAQAATANGISGMNLARPTARSMVGGASAASGGINGGTMRHRP